MHKLENIQNIYFIGIGGIGMSALARYFKARGAMVSGYDRTPTPLTKQLEAAGMAIHYTEDVEQTPAHPDVVVYTPAIPATHAELVHYRNNGFTVVKRSDVLQWITEGSFNICVGGTHGKTTVTSMIAHLLRHSGYGCNAFLGGISANYDTNFWSSERNVVVVEADEYDRSFLKLVPDIAVVTAIDPDHLDIYGTPQEVENAFVQFASKVKPGGCLITRKGLSRETDLNASHTLRYARDMDNADVRVTDLKVVDGSYHFNVQGTGWSLTEVVFHMGGLHNVENVLAAIAIAKFLRITDDRIKAAIADYKGVRRRFEYALKGNNILIDDYAHHPEELKALISGVRSLYPNKKLTLIFQPHLFSRTNDLANGFASSLDMADDVVLLPIYPARELPMPGVTSQLLLDKMQLKEKRLLEKDAMLEWLATEKPELVVMAGAGDIDGLIQPAKKILE